MGNWNIRFWPRWVDYVIILPALVAFFWVFGGSRAFGPEPVLRAKVSRAKNDMRSMSTALEAYFSDHKSYPGMQPFISRAKDRGPIDKSGAGTLSMPQPGNLRTHGLTTPIAYLTSLPVDPFSPDKETFAYCTTGSTTQTWLLISPGPDRKYDIQRPDELLLADDPHPSNYLLTFTYDPTNGSVSPGDIWKVKQ